jgi:hypothetical protein
LYNGFHEKDYRGLGMSSTKNIAYVTDEKGNKKNVLLRLSDFEKMREGIEDLEDALALERAKRNAIGFKKWKDFIKEIETARKA